MTRNEKILSKIDTRHGQGLELGPLSTPILTKDEAKIYFVDHMSTKDLRKKYTKEPVDLDKIVDVDYALGTSTLSEVVGSKKFDYVLASHVIEHVPDVITWLQDIAKVLKPGGILSLIIPDKRYTFDITRADSRPADVIGAYVDRLTRTSGATMYDFAVEYRTSILAPEVLAAPFADYSKKPRRYSAKESLDMTEKNAARKEYVDAHSFVFTPYSFMEIAKSLIEHELFDYKIIDFHDTATNEIEFYVSLQKIAKKDPASQKKSVPRLPKPPTNQELQLRVRQLEQQIHEVLTSTSWKLTSPLRKALNAVLHRQK